MQVADDLRKRIRDGEFPLGAKMPSLRALTNEYEVSEVTAHTAIRALQHEGVLESTSGRGTFVKSLPSGETGADQPVTLEELRAEVRALAARVERLESHGHKSTRSRPK